MILWVLVAEQNPNRISTFWDKINEIFFIHRNQIGREGMNDNFGEFVANQNCLRTASRSDFRQLNKKLCNKFFICDAETPHLVLLFNSNHLAKHF